MPRPRSACVCCATIKSACSKTKPCSRCTRLGLLCSFEGALPPRGVSVRNTTNANLKRVKHNNSSQGCLTCLTRRKKCDEFFPVCGECLRLGLVCSPRPSPSATRLPLPDGPGASNSSCRDSQSPFSRAFSEESRQKNRVFFAKEYLDWVALLDESHASYLTRRGHLNDSSALMYRNTSMDSPTSVRLDPALQNFHGVDPRIIAQWHPTEQHLLNHFLQVVSRALVVVHDDRNPFLLEIVPMALINLSVRHAMLALTAQHLCRVYPVFEDTLFSQKTLALHYLKQELQAHVATSYALAATLLSCLSEICQGNSRKWILHLYGAKALMESPASHDPSGKFLIQLYERLCSMAIMTSDKAPLVLHEALSEPRDPEPSEGLYIEIHPILGFAEDLCGYLKSINQMAIQRSNRNESRENETAFNSQAETIEASLRRWSPPTLGEDSWDFREAVSAAEALRWGCFIWLQHVRYGRSMSVQQRQTALDHILSSVSRIRPGSTFDVQLLFPLFMAGISATLKSERLRIEYRLNILEGNIGTGNIAGAHKLLDTVWKRLNEGDDDVDWELLLQNEYGGVVLQ